MELKQKKSKAKSKFRTFRKGFSFLEVVISIAIFSVVTVYAVAAFVYVIKTQKSSRTIQNNLESAGTAMELMTKTIRMSSNLTQSGKTIYMYNNSQGKCISYKFGNDDKLQAAEKEGEGEDCGSSSGYSSYADLVSNVDGKFSVTETDSESDPPVIGEATILVETSDTKLQTSVSFVDYQGTIQ